MLCIASLYVGFESHARFSLIREFVLYVFKRDRYAIKNIGCSKGQGAGDQSTVTRRSKEFRSGRKKIDDQVKTGRLKTMEIFFLQKLKGIIVYLFIHSFVYNFSDRNEVYFGRSSRILRMDVCHQAS